MAPSVANPILANSGSTAIQNRARLADLARRPTVRLADLLRASGLEEDPDATHWADVELKYGGYLAREKQSARRVAAMDELRIPGDMEYAGLAALSFEAREKLQRIQPASLGQASRIPGVSRSDIQNLVAELLRSRGAR